MTERFGGLSAVHEVTLEFPPRGVSCLIGPNGAGKSTLLNLLSGQSRVTSGSVTLDGQDLTAWPPYRRARSGISVKLQVASIYAELTARENLWLACYAMPRDVAAADKRSEELLEWLLLRDHADSPAGTLSHGQKQWLEIGMVVAANPAVVLPAEDIREFCRGTIAHYKVPRYIKFTDAFPMTITGKIQKFKMRDTSVEELGLGAAASARSA